MYVEVMPIKNFVINSLGYEHDKVYATITIITDIGGLIPRPRHKLRVFELISWSVVWSES